MTENAVRELTKANQELASRVRLLESYLCDADAELVLLRSGQANIPKPGECTVGCLAAAERDVLWAKLRECNESKKELKKEFRNRIFERELEVERLRGFTATPPPPSLPQAVEYTNAETQLATPITHEKPLRVLSNSMQVEPQSLFTTNGYDQMEVPSAISIRRADSPELLETRFTDMAGTPDTVQTSAPPATSIHPSPSRQLLLGRLEAAQQWGDESAVKQIRDSLKEIDISAPQHEVLQSIDQTNGTSNTVGSSFVRNEADKYLSTKVANTEALLKASENRNQNLADEVVALRLQVREHLSNEEVNRKVSQQLRRELEVAVLSETSNIADQHQYKPNQHNRNITPPRRQQQSFTTADELSSPPCVLVSQHVSPIKDISVPLSMNTTAAHSEIQRSSTNISKNKFISKPIVSPKREAITAATPAIRMNLVSGVQLVPQKSQQHHQSDKLYPDSTSDSRSSSNTKQVVINTSSTSGLDRRGSVSLRGDGSSIRVSPQRERGGSRKAAAYHNYSGHIEQSHSSSVSLGDSELLLDTSTQHFNDSTGAQLKHFKPRKGRESNGPYISASKKF